MKQSITILLLLISIVVSAQDFQGKATYKTHRKIDLKISDGENAPNAEVQKQLLEQLKKQSQKTYFLNFTQAESIYKQEEQLSAPQPKAGGIQISFSDGSDLYYKNIKENRYTSKKEIFGKRFLIKDSIQKKDWQLTGETKNIGQYTCYKATRSKEIEYNDFTVENGETKEEKKKKIIVTTAWYTPQIPVSNGPSHYQGLPGLILEINEGKLTIVCSEIILNSKEKIVIEEPTKGKVVSQDEFDKIMEKKQKEMMEQFKSNNRGSKKGKATIIKIGG